jgi:hypothetical protein
MFNNFKQCGSSSSQFMWQLLGARGCWLRHYATTRNVLVLISDYVLEFSVDLILPAAREPLVRLVF